MDFPVEIVRLLASPLHRYEGRPKDGPVPFEGRESHKTLTVREGLGIVGDRHFGRKAHVQASVTIMSMESLEAVARELQTAIDPDATRRNIILRGYPVDELRGRTFSLSGVLMKAHRPANPCAWMDEQLAPGAFRALRRRGGMRCEPLSNGELRLGPAILTIETAGD